MNGPDETNRPPHQPTDARLDQSTDAPLGAPLEAPPDAPVSSRWPFRLGAGIVALAMVVGVASACLRLWPDLRPEPGPSELEVTALPAVREPDTLYLPGFQPPPHLDPARTITVMEYELLYNVMEGLVRIGPDGDVQPAVAERWDCEPGATVCRFYLRQGARWSDGVEITAADFVYGWLRVLDPAHASDNAGRLFLIDGAREFASLDISAPDYAIRYEAARAAVGIEAADRYTLTVRLQAAPPYFLQFLADASTLPQRQDVVERHGADYATAPDRMVFNGPFVISEWRDDVDFVLEPNPEYWDADAVHLKRVVIMMLPDHQTALAAFDAGEIDQIGLSDLSKDYYREYAGLEELLEAATFYMVLNVDSPMLQRWEVREALHLALDRRTIAEAIFGGAVFPAAGLVPPTLSGMPGESFRDAAGALVPLTGDAAAARSLWNAALAADGLTGRELTLLHIDADGAAAEADLWASVFEHTLPGLSVSLSASSFEDLAARRRQGDFDLLTMGWIADYDDPTTFLNLFRSDDPTNYSGWRSAEYDALLDRADRTADPAERVALLAEAEALLLADLPVLPLYHTKKIVVRQPNVTGIIDVPVLGILFLKEARVGDLP